MVQFDKNEGVEMSRDEARDCSQVGSTVCPHLSALALVLVVVDDDESMVITVGAR